MTTRLITGLMVALLLILLVPFTRLVGAYRSIVWLPTPDFVKQKTDFTCGPAALQRVLTAWNVTTSEDVLAEKAGTTSKGTSLQGSAPAGPG